MKEYLIKRPMLIAGILCCIISVVGFKFSKLLLPIGIMFAIIIGFMIFKKVKPQIIIAVLLGIAMLVSMFLNLRKIENLNHLKNTEQQAELVICEEPHRYDGYYATVVETLASEKLKSGVKLYAFFEPQELAMGEIIVANLKIKEIKEEYKASNYSSGIYLNANMSDIKVQTDKNDIVLTGVGKLRTYIKNTLFKNMGYEQAATTCALLFGDNSYFSNEFYANVKKAGVSHVMVVSGMHLSILVSLFAFIINNALYNRYAKAFVTIFVVLALTAICGFTMSILRAGITYFIMALSLIVNRQSTPENTLGAAICVILISSPLAIYSIALQLSMLSTFGILVVALPIISYCRKNKIIEKGISLSVFSAVVTSISAMILTAPVVIYVFNYISVVAIITNLLISTVVTAVLWVAVCGLILFPILPYVAKFLFVICDVLVEYVNSIINYFGSRFYSTVDVPKEAAILAIFLIIFIFKILLACKVKHNMLKLKEMQEKIIEEGGKTVKWR